MKLSLLTEGTSDVVLLRPLRWLINDIDGALDYRLERIDFAVLPYPPKSLEERLTRAVEVESPDLLLVHRDADGSDPRHRYQEIEEAIRSVKIETPCIALVPVTMTESWFMFDEGAMRKAAGNPRGTVRLELPDPDRLVSKNELYAQLRIASGKRGRHLRRLRPEDMFHVLADSIDDFSPLDRLSSFRTLRKALVDALRIQRSEH